MSSSELPEVIAASVPIVSITDVLEYANALVIDLRSPAEFDEDHIPGASNVPLFDDTDRALVGLLYRQFSPDAAFAEGTAVTLRGIRDLVAEIARLADWTVPEAGLEERVRAMTEAGIERLSESLQAVAPTELPERPVFLHCWRGGLRSRATVSFLRSLGFSDVFGVEGGYKAYRRTVPTRIAEWSAPPAFALRGLTGVGKTLVLRELQQLQPHWVFDLEAFAGHRSSLLGMVGLEPCSQKMFESRMLTRIEAGFGGVVVYEGESRKVGDVIIPARVWSSLRGATNIELTASVETRVRVLIDDYLADDSARPALRAQLALIEKRMDRKCALVELFDAGRDGEVVELLLEHYYDPLYRHSESGQSYALSIASDDPAAAAQKIADWIAECVGARPNAVSRTPVR